MAAVPMPRRLFVENGVDELRPGKLADGWAAPFWSSAFKLMSRPGPEGAALTFSYLRMNCSICSRE